MLTLISFIPLRRSATLSVTKKALVATSEAIVGDDVRWARNIEKMDANGDGDGDGSMETWF